MTDDDPDNAYAIIPHPDDWLQGWFLVTRNGEPWRTCPTRQAADRYATDAGHRAKLAAAETPLHLRPGFGRK